MSITAVDCRLCLFGESEATGFTVPEPDPDVPSEPGLLVGTDLPGDRFICLN